MAAAMVAAMAAATADAANKLNKNKAPETAPSLLLFRFSFLCFEEQPNDNQDDWDKQEVRILRKNRSSLFPLWP